MITSAVLQRDASPHTGDMLTGLQSFLLAVFGQGHSKKLKSYQIAKTFDPCSVNDKENDLPQAR